MRRQGLCLFFRIMSQCEVIRSILFSDIQNRPSYAFSALWVDNTDPSYNDALRFTRVLINVSMLSDTFYFVSR